MLDFCNKNGNTVNIKTELSETSLAEQQPGRAVQ